MAKRSSRRVEKAAKKHPVIAAIAVIAVIALVVAALFWYYSKRPPRIEAGDPSGIADAGFSVHFLDVGNKYTGDCVLIDCGETEVLIDAGSRKSSGGTLVNYINGYCSDGKLEIVIATHSDQDHIAAFLGESGKNNGIFDNFSIGTFIMFGQSGKQAGEKNLYGQFLNAVDALPESTEVFKAGQCYDETDGASRQYFLNEEKTLSLNILYNYYYYNVDKNNENNHSVVTLLTYEKDGKTSRCLFTGDLEKSGEEKLVGYYKNPANSKSAYDVLPEVDLFKAGHHGSYTASGEELLSVIKPKYVAVTCCAGSDEYAKDPAHYFPAREFTDRILKYTEEVYCTCAVSDSEEGYRRLNGDIVFYYKDGFKLYCSGDYTPLPQTEWFKANRTA